MQSTMERWHTVVCSLILKNTFKVHETCGACAVQSAATVVIALGNGTAPGCEPRSHTHRRLAKPSSKHNTHHLAVSARLTLISNLAAKRRALTIAATSAVSM